MRTRRINIEKKEEIKEAGCCSTPTSKNKNSDPCCEQPTDGSSCCDNSATKEVNSNKTGCC